MAPREQLPGLTGHLRHIPWPRLDPDPVVDSLAQSLLTAEIFFCSLHRNMAQQKLNLFQFAARTVAETST